jgi:alpha-tubulin suppressor-like RCC1 family protein
MTPNTFGRLVMLVALVAGLTVGLADRATAQILRLPLPNPIIHVTIAEFQEITAGANHTCVRKFDGTVYCWGLDTNGQIGISATNAKCQDLPVQDPAQISIAPATYQPCVDKPNYVTTLGAAPEQISAGTNHTCVLNGGVVSCWGGNSMGQLGNGDPSLLDKVAAQNVNTSAQFTSVAAGDQGTCGLSTSGIFCWGQVPYNPLANSSFSPSTVTPKLLFSSLGFANLTMGSRFACFVWTQGGQNQNDCTGIDNVGQLGVVNMAGSSSAPSWMPRDTNNVPFAAPFMVASSLGQLAVTRSSAGYAYVCGDLNNSTVQCMGSNSAGQLGTNGGDRADAEAVVNNSGVAATLHGVTAGFSHACALDGSGYAYCWGAGDYGQLGGVAIGYGTKAYYAYQVSTSIKFSALAAGGNHTCGIGVDGSSIYCWGDNEYGQLGVGMGNLAAGSNFDSHLNGFTPPTYTSTPQRIPSF